MQGRDEQVANTFLFADLAGFTALTEAHGDEQAADLAADFFRRVRECLPDYGAEAIKTLGDALLLRVPEAADAVRLGLRITDDVLADHGHPGVRVGMHHGTAVERAGDWFGSTVNVAARVAAVAAADEVLLTEATRAAAGQIEGIALEARGRRRLQNVIEPVELFAARRLERAARSGLVTDPVCRMAVDPERAAGKLMHEGRTYWFCSLECAGRFSREPDAYAREA